MLCISSQPVPHDLKSMPNLWVQMAPPEEGSGLAGQAEAFNQNVLQQQERSVWAQYCQHKADAAANGTDRETWTWLHLLFQEDASR